MTLEPLHDLPSLSDRAYVAIKEAILSLKIRPGEILSIGGLAKQLEVSRTPVRDALLSLEKDGLVTIIPQKGAHVTKVSEADINDIFELRILLERYATRVATTRLTVDDLEQAASLQRQAERAFEQGQHLSCADLGRQFHDLLVETVGNNRMKEVLGHLDTHYIRMRRFAAIIPGRFKKSHEEHKVILRFLQNSDAAGAEQAMSNHLASVRDEMLVNPDTWNKYLENERIRPEPNGRMLPAL